MISQKFRVTVKLQKVDWRKNYIFYDKKYIKCDNCTIQIILNENIKVIRVIGSKEEYVYSTLISIFEIFTLQYGHFYNIEKCYVNGKLDLYYMKWHLISIKETTNIKSINDGYLLTGKIINRHTNIMDGNKYLSNNLTRLIRLFSDTYEKVGVLERLSTILEIYEAIIRHTNDYLCNKINYNIGTDINDKILENGIVGIIKATGLNEIDAFTISRDMRNRSWISRNDGNGLTQIFKHLGIGIEDIRKIDIDGMSKKDKKKIDKNNYWEYIIKLLNAFRNEIKHSLYKTSSISHIGIFYKTGGHHTVLLLLYDILRVYLMEMIGFELSKEEKSNIIQQYYASAKCLRSQTEKR